MAGSGPGLDAWREVCSACGRVWPLTARRWVCTCGGLLDLVGPLADPLSGSVVGGPSGSLVEAPSRSPGNALSGSPAEAPSGSPAETLPGSPLVRYGAALPPGSGTADLGLAVTRVEEVEPGVFVKADYEQPTGSFKDRGASVMIGAAGRLGVDSVVVDSSGNAGKAAAAHAARAGMRCTVYLPAGTAPAKVASIAAYGATVVEVPGGRQAAAEAAQRDVTLSGRWYASHVHQPLFHHGVKTLAFELFEQVPALAGGSVFVPAGNGTLVLGLWLGFGELVALGRMPRRPAIVAVQAEACAPLAGAVMGEPEAGRSAGFPSGGVDPTAGGEGGAGGGRGGPAGDDGGRGGRAGDDGGRGGRAGDERAAARAARVTAAAGIAIPAPPRARQIRAAVLATGGRVAVVGEDAIHDARAELAARGLEVEPTGAVAWAGLRASVAGRLSPQPAVVVLTGR